MKGQANFRNMAVVCLTILVLGIPGLSNAEASFSRVYVFGDSLSDTGNLASVIGDFPSPFFENRVSNGPVGVEILAARLDLTAEASFHLMGVPSVGSNYAVAGARAISSQAIDLSTQIMLFLANHGSVAPSDALYVIFIGGNDLRAARDVPGLVDAKVIVRAAAKEVRIAIETLAQTGAHTFLLVNSPNIGAIPETRLIAGATDNPKLIIKRARKVSKLYRKELHKIAEQLDDDYGIEIVEFDLFKFFKNLLRKADLLGFTNTTDACFSLTFGFRPDCNSGDNFDQFIFFDEIHPTARVHEFVGEALFEALEDDDDDD